MSETLVWLLYLIGGTIAFFLVRRAGWKLTNSTLAGALVAVGAWALWYQLTSDEKRPPFFDVHLALNASFAVIFASAGAALAAYLASRDRDADGHG